MFRSTFDPLWSVCLSHIMIFSLYILSAWFHTLVSPKAVLQATTSISTCQILIMSRWHLITCNICHNVSALDELDFFTIDLESSLKLHGTWMNLDWMQCYLNWLQGNSCIFPGVSAALWQPLLRRFFDLCWLGCHRCPLRRILHVSGPKYSFWNQKNVQGCCCYTVL